jgi:hypothetical protein
MRTGALPHFRAISEQFMAPVGANCAVLYSQRGEQQSHEHLLSLLNFFSKGSDLVITIMRVVVVIEVVSPGYHSRPN